MDELEFSQRIRLAIPSLDLYVSSRTQRQYVDDICSDAIAIAWQKREKIPSKESTDSHDPLLPFLILTARNLIKNLERKLGTSKRHLMDLLPPDSPSAENVALLDGVLNSALQKLKPRDRELLLLLAWHELSIAEIATVLRMSKANVSVRLNRSRNRLSEILQEISREEH
jgi:RNA polymerase sigma-70 factor (ECF subfamily)